MARKHFYWMEITVCVPSASTEFPYGPLRAQRKWGLCGGVESKCCRCRDRLIFHFGDYFGNMTSVWSVGRCFLITLSFSWEMWLAQWLPGPGTQASRCQPGAGVLKGPWSPFTQRDVPVCREWSRRCRPSISWTCAPWPSCLCPSLCWPHSARAAWCTRQILYRQTAESTSATFPHWLGQLYVKLMGRVWALQLTDLDLNPGSTNRLDGWPWEII